jgi:hypothetical protein
MQLGKQIGQLEGHHTSVTIDYVGNDLRCTSNMEGRITGLLGEGTFAWAQVAVANEAVKIGPIFLHFMNPSHNIII